MKQDFFRIENVSFFYRHVQVLNDISLTVQKGSVLCVLGKSGAGKSTLLRVIAGILKPSSGRILVGGHDRTNVPMHERKELGYVFQSGDGLFPHLSVYHNVAFPFSHGNRSLTRNRDWQSAVTSMLNVVGLVEKKNSMVWELSGGMAQRVALARSLVYEPDILLLDEPLGSLDNALKIELTDLLRTLQRQTATTFVYVTHDEREALAFGTHIAVMDEGHVEQFGETATLISQPRSATVARLIGGWNVLEYKPNAAGELDDGERAIFAFAAENVDQPGTPSSHVVGFPIERLITDNGAHARTHAGDSVNIKAMVLRVQPWYDRKHVITRTPSGQMITATVVDTIHIQEGQEINLTIRSEHIHVFKH